MGKRLRKRKKRSSPSVYKASSLSKRRKKPTFKRKLRYYNHKFHNKLRELQRDLTNTVSGLLLFVVAGIAFWFLFQILIMFYGFDLFQWFKDLPYLYDIFSGILLEIQSGSNLGIFYAFLFSSLFFLPLPTEALFFKYLHDGIVLERIFFLAVGGIVAGQIVNYCLGRFFKFIFIRFIKRKTRKGIRRNLQKYGSITVTAFHVFPLPFPVFNFVTGVLRYSFLKWFTFVVIGMLVKHAIMYWMYITLF